ncbi:hypothetical protein [Paracoccus benzoatiresistens]|uniref:Uncharacterized protein n=1 Tax=Paracoccus benzoatiresistens TaxID=2997341 RepID=A0ABT4J9Y6_9RHOB|nr:hypothetical protein [Paracoccus sp. EF6]MCZ0963887.1 hypothetical protein [Paracoccus sp. EF6]
MATITKTSMAGPGARAATETMLTATNVLTYEPGTGQVLILRNPTAGAVSSVIDGADGTTFPVPGIGNVDVSAGFSVGSIPAGAVRVIPLDPISAYLQGAINVTGTGLVAILLGA